MPTISTEDATLDYASIELSILGAQFDGVKSIKYDDELSSAYVYGTGARPIGRTLGQYKATCAISLYRNQWEKLKGLLGGNNYKRTVFTAVVKHSVNPGDPIITDTLERLRVMKMAAGGQEGSDPLVVDLDCSIMNVLSGGNDSLGDPTTSTA